VAPRQSPALAVGQLQRRAPLELALCALLADGHVLIEDYPGLAKTLIAQSFATVTGWRFARVRFTPDDPIEYEGTYPLPEAQLDRFLIRMQVGYPSADEGGRSCTAASRAAKTRPS
jgi:MoxR-like ATPase